MNSRERATCSEKSFSAIPKELFPPTTSGNLLVGLSTSTSVSLPSMIEEKSALKDTDQSSFLDKKSTELKENLYLLQIQLKSANDQLQIVRTEYEKESSKANGRREKLCCRCHLAGHYKDRCVNPPCKDMKKCGASE